MFGDDLSQTEGISYNMDFTSLQIRAQRLKTSFHRQGTELMEHLAMCPVIVNTRRPVVAGDSLVNLHKAILNQVSFALIFILPPAEIKFLFLDITWLRQLVKLYLKVQKKNKTGTWQKP